MNQRIIDRSLPLNLRQLSEGECGLGREYRLIRTTMFEELPAHAEVFLQMIIFIDCSLIFDLFITKQNVYAFRESIVQLLL